MVGKHLGGTLIEVPTTNRGWHEEFLMFRGGDLGYLPTYSDGIMGGIRRVEQLEQLEVLEAKKFVGGKPKGLWSERHFRMVSFLVSRNRKFEGISVYQFIVCN